VPLDNRRVQRISRGLGGALTFHPGEVEARLAPPWPDPLSASEEWLDEAGALLGPGPTPWAGLRPSWRDASASVHLRPYGGAG
jgi:hypothetical protein